MAGPFSAYLKNAMLDSVFGSGSPATVYVALTVAGVEVSGSGYTRAAVTNNSTNFPAASGGAKTNGTAITFPTPTGSWGTPDGVRLYDDLTAGNLLATPSLGASFGSVVADNLVVVPIAALTLTLTDPS